MAPLLAVLKVNFDGTKRKEKAILAHVTGDHVGNLMTPGGQLSSSSSVLPAKLMGFVWGFFML